MFTTWKVCSSCGGLDDRIRCSRKRGEQQCSTVFCVKNPFNESTSADQPCVILNPPTGHKMWSTEVFAQECLRWECPGCFDGKYPHQLNVKEYRWHSMWKTDCEHHNGKCRSPSFYVLADLTYRDLGMAWLGAVAGRWHVENCEPYCELLLGDSKGGLETFLKTPPERVASPSNGCFVAMCLMARGESLNNNLIWGGKTWKDPFELCKGVLPPKYWSTIQAALRSTLFLITNTPRRRVSEIEGRAYMVGLKEGTESFTSMVSVRVWDPTKPPQFALLLPFMATHIQHYFGAGRDIRQALRAAWIYQSRVPQMFNLTVATRTQGVEEWDYADFNARPFGQALPSEDVHASLCLENCSGRFGKGGNHIADWVLLSRKPEVAIIGSSEQGSGGATLPNFAKLMIKEGNTHMKAAFLACRTSGFGVNLQLADNERIKFDAGVAIIERLVCSSP